MTHLTIPFLFMAFACTTAGDILGHDDGGGTDGGAPCTGAGCVEGDGGRADAGRSDAGEMDDGGPRLDAGPMLAYCDTATVVDGVLDDEVLVPFDFRGAAPGPMPIPAICRDPGPRGGQLIVRYRVPGTGPVGLYAETDHVLSYIMVARTCPGEESVFWCARGTQTLATHSSLGLTANGGDEVYFVVHGALDPFETMGALHVRAQADPQPPELTSLTARYNDRGRVEYTITTSDPDDDVVAVRVLIHRVPPMPVGEIEEHFERVPNERLFPGYTLPPQTDSPLDVHGWTATVRAVDSSGLASAPLDAIVE